MNRIENLLNQVSIISKKNAEILDATGGRFNMFRMCGVNHYENTHSAILAEFLNPKGTHGLKSQLLECFIETLKDYFSVQNFNCKNAIVRTEVLTPNGRIDILIEDAQRKNAIIIENKIYANDQLEQLKRYDKYAEVTYEKGNYQILYLTLEGTAASEQSAGEVEYLQLSYYEHIINWLEKCVAIASRFPMVRETIIQYINHLKQLTNQDMDNKNKEEIINLLSSKIENLKAAQTISQNYTATFDAIAKKYFNTKMEEFAKKNGLEYHYEKSEESYIKFHFTNPLWLGKCWIGFTFEGNRCHYGLVNNPDNYRLSNETRETIHKKLDDFPRKTSEWCPFYAYMPELTLESWESDIMNSNNFAEDCTKKIDRILKAMEGIEL